jgi:hypothetical protein
MEFDAAASIAVTFDNGAGGTSYGLLILIDPSHFSGDISGFAGSAGDLAHSDGIDVIGINFNSSQFSDSYDSSTGILTLSDGTNTETLDFTGFKGNVNNFHFADDANGNGTLITDPPGLANSAAVSLVSSEATNSVTTQTSNLNLSTTNNETTTELGPNASVTVGPDGDHFVFNPGIGAETVTNFNWQQDTLELDHFANAQTTGELQSLITSDGNGSNSTGSQRHHRAAGRDYERIAAGNPSRPRSFALNRGACSISEQYVSDAAPLRKDQKLFAIRLGRGRSTYGPRLP